MYSFEHLELKGPVQCIALALARESNLLISLLKYLSQNKNSQFFVVGMFCLRLEGFQKVSVVTSLITRWCWLNLKWRDVLSEKTLECKMVHHGLKSPRFLAYQVTEGFLMALTFNIHKKMWCHFISTCMLTKHYLSVLYIYIYCVYILLYDCYRFYHFDNVFLWLCVSSVHA